jgi:hypothetical protein
VNGNAGCDFHTNELEIEFLNHKFYPMNISIKPRLATDAKKVFYSLEWGRIKGQRVATGIFTYVKPANQIEKNHNKEAREILKRKRSQLILERQTIHSGYIPERGARIGIKDGRRRLRELLFEPGSGGPDQPGIG